MPKTATLLKIVSVCALAFFSGSLSGQTLFSVIDKLADNRKFLKELATINRIKTDSVKNRELQILSQSLTYSAAESEASAGINLYNLLGAYYESVSDYPAALKVLRKALSENSHQFPEKEMFSFNYLGYIFWHRSNYDSAFFYHRRSLKIAINQRLHNTELAFTYIMLGNDYFDTGDYVKTSENYFEGLKVYESLNDTAGLIIAHNRLGKMYYKLKDPKRARHHLAISEKLNRKLLYQRETAFSFNSHGNIQIERNNLDSALYCFGRTFQLYQSTGDIIGQSVASINLGDTYYAVFSKTRRTLFSDSSYLYYRKSLQLNSKVDNRFGMIYGWWGMADNLLARDKADEALGFYREALQTSISINARSEEASLYWKLHKIFEHRDRDSAYSYLKKFISAKTLIENEERTNDLLRQESKYQIEKRVAEETIKMEQRNVLNAEKNKWKNYALAGIILITLVLCYLVVISVKRMRIIGHKNEVINSINQALSSQNKEITDSINYARRIQNAILPSEKEFKKLFPESFILYKPKNIVAGDFYWLQASAGTTVSENETTILFAAADCTGHGVPGAMVSVICNNGLNRSVREYGLTDPGQILDKTREIVIQEFEKSDEDVKDGMDISLVALTKTQNIKGEQTVTVQWSGANNPLWIVQRVVSNDEQKSQALEASYSLVELKPDKQPIGKHTENKPFTTHSLSLNKGDCLYVFTDGYADQFGGVKGKKFKAANFKNLLLSIRHEEMDRQKEIIDHTFEEWRGKLEQVDDVCVIGIRV